MESAGKSSPPEHHDSSNGNIGEEAAQTSNWLVPPYWSHHRYESYCSIENTKPPPITLEDHTDEQSSVSNAAWAKGVAIDDYVLVAGSVPNVGKFTVWNCRIDTLDVSDMFLLIKQQMKVSEGLKPSHCAMTCSQEIRATLHTDTDSKQGSSIMIRKRWAIAELCPFLKC